MNKTSVILIILTTVINANPTICQKLSHGSPDVRLEMMKMWKMTEMLELISKNPYLSEINNGIMRNEGHLKIYENDRLVR